MGKNNITITGNITNWYNAPVYQAQQRGGSRKCYNCQGTGHLSKNCTKPRIGGSDRGGRGGGGRGARGSGGGRGGRGGGGRRGSGRERDVSREGMRSLSTVRSRSRSPLPKSRSTSTSKSIPNPLPTNVIIRDESYDTAVTQCNKSRSDGVAATSSDQ